MILTSLGTAASLHRAERRLPLIDVDSRLVILVHRVGIAALYGRTAGG